MIIPTMGTLPARQHSDDAGADLAIVQDVHIPAGEIRTVELGTQLAIPRHPSEVLTRFTGSIKAYAGLILPRSGLGARGVTLANSVGLIDAGYRGVLKAALINHSREAVKLAAGERVAQLVLIEVMLPQFVEVEHFDGLTERGAGGFGSTGMAS